MANVKAYLFSILTRQQLLLRAGFAQRYPHAWLVWEPGPWSPPSEEGGTGATQLPSSGPEVPAKGDALCFELDLAPGERVRLGRSPDNEVVLNDATISRHHLLIERSTVGLWSAAAAPESRPSLLHGVALTAEGMPLSPGVMLRLGDVSLTYHSSTSFAARAAEAAAKLA